MDWKDWDEAAAAEEVIKGSEHFFTPVDMMASRFKTWVAKWQKARDTTQDTVMAIQEVRQCAKANQDLPKITLGDLHEALATMNEATGLGARLVDLLNQCEEQVAWPWQVYITLVCLLAKEVKGERRISLLTMLYRIWSRTRKAFATEWCDAKAGFWDDAVRGSSPLQAALRRLVADELTQNTDNQEACTVLFDVGKLLRFHFIVLGGSSWIEIGIHPCAVEFGLACTCRGALLNRRLQRLQRRYCHQQWSGSGMRAGQPCCKIGALRHFAEVARAAPVHHDCAMGGPPGIAHAGSAE